MHKVVIFILVSAVVMPLTNNVIIKLNEITVMVSDKQQLDQNDTAVIKGVFETILKGGEFYDVDDIESWFENEGSWKNKAVRTRITNLAHYVQSKHEQTATLRIVSDESCQCDDDDPSH